MPRAASIPTIPFAPETLMRSDQRMLATAALVPLLFTLASCASEPGPATEETTFIEGKDSAAVVETYRAAAAVAAINFDNRKITLLFSDGRERTYKADKQIANFNQIKVGDQVIVTVIEELAVFLNKGREGPSAGSGAAVALKPLGARPGIVVADSTQVTATVTAVDTKTRTVGLQFVDGSRKTIKVAKSVDLNKVRPGDDVTAQLTEAVALVVEKS
jgi:hypothetical protein